MIFREWLKNKLNFGEISRIYDKTNIAVDLVNRYDPKILNNISTIANLNQNAYGLYNSGENKNIIDPTKEQKLIYLSKNKINKDKLEHLPNEILKSNFPDLDMNKVYPSDVIHVNIRKILNDPNIKNDLDAILEIASTIIHEATHEIEKRTLGRTNETGPLAAERKFAMWAKGQMNSLIAKIKTMKPTLVKSRIS